MGNVIMGKINAAWNKDKTASVVLSKLKEFTIQENAESKWVLRGWYNKDNCFNFGEFNYQQEAQDYLDEIHKNL